MVTKQQQVRLLQFEGELQQRKALQEQVRQILHAGYQMEELTLWDRVLSPDYLKELRRLAWSICRLAWTLMWRAK